MTRTLGYKWMTHQPNGKQVGIDMIYWGYEEGEFQKFDGKLEFISTHLIQIKLTMKWKADHLEVVGISINITRIIFLNLNNITKVESIYYTIQ